jgi:hypothetical protein
MSTLLIRLVPQEPPYVLVLDRTEWHFGQTPVNVLMIGIAHRGIAFPVAWTALPKTGGSGSEEQIEVLGAALRALDAEEVESLTAEREFISVAWLKRLQAASIPFVIRLRSGRRLRLGGASWRGRPRPSREDVRPRARHRRKPGRRLAEA